MVTQTTSLIVCLFLTQIVANPGVQFVMDRNPNNYFCGNLQCVADITDSDNTVFSFVDMTIYDITRANSELKVASVSIFQPNLYVDTTKSSALSCTGVISGKQANLTVQLRHDIDCLYGVFKCQLNLITVLGHSDVVTEIVTPEYNHSFSRISDVSNRVDRLAVLLNDQSARVNAQTAEIKRLADIVYNKLLPLIEQTAQVCNSSETPDLNRKEKKLPNDTYDEMEKPEGKPESLGNLSNRTGDKIQNVLHMIALDKPMAGSMRGIRGADYECHRHARRSGLNGTYRAFLSSDTQNLHSILFYSRDIQIPIVNAKNQVLFQSWNEIVNGNGAYMNGDATIYSFDGRDIMSDSQWPQKIVWHGSDGKGKSMEDQFCNKWHSSASNSMGRASSLLKHKLLDQEEYTCNNTFIVLCIENSARPN